MSLAVLYLARFRNALKAAIVPIVLVVSVNLILASYLAAASALAQMGDFLAPCRKSLFHLLAPFSLSTPVCAKV